MFRLTSKVKIAAGLAAGALTLGGAGAYAAANASSNGTVPVSTLKTVTGGTAGTLTVMSTNGKTTTLTIPATFSNLGQCVSFFAQHQDLVLQPAAGTTRISKNSHGKLISGIKTWCETRLTSAAKTDSTETTTPDATPSTDATDSTDTRSGASHGQGQVHRHGHNPTA
jgi:hypothetical protein